MIDFSTFVDGESIVQEDLVVYFNLGSHHLPDASDLPNTLMHTSASSVMFTPHNFFDRDPSRQSSQGVRLALAERGQTKYFGGKYEHDLHVKLVGFRTPLQDMTLETDVMQTDLEPDLKNYHAFQHEVKKMPWEDHLGPGPKKPASMDSDTGPHEAAELAI